MSSKPNQASSNRGFSLIESMLVVTISAILIVGLAAIVEMPARLVEQEQGNAPLSSADRFLARLDEDVRFAVDVSTPDSRTLSITDRSANTITYQWDGVIGGVVTRSALAGTSTLANRVESLAFSLGQSELTLDPEDVATLEGVVETASFEQFSLKSGYSMAAGPQQMATTKVTEIIAAVEVSKQLRGGIYFQATGISEDQGQPVSVRLRARRNGSGKLVVRIVKPKAGQVLPDKNEVVATGSVASSALPVSMSDIAIPLTCYQNMIEGEMYFMVIKTSKHSPNGPCIDLETRTLSDADAAEASNGYLIYSTDGGASFAPIAATEAASQTRFGLDVQTTLVTGGGGPTTVQIPTSVLLALRLQAEEGGQTLHTAVPVENNLVKVNQ